MIAMSDLKPILTEINQNLINFADAKDDLPSYEKWSEIDFSEELKQLEEEKEEGDQIEVKPEEDLSIIQGLSTKNDNIVFFELKISSTDDLEQIEQFL